MSAEEPQGERLELDVRLPQDSVPLDREVGLVVVLANRGASAAFVNRRLLVAPPGTPDPFHEVTFEVEGPPGYVNRKLAQVNSGRPRPEDFAELAPGDAVEKSFELTRLHSMHLPGKYSVRATYSNSVELEELERRPWIGTATSEWCVVERA